MRNILQATLFVLSIFILQNAKAQDTIVYIPDDNFKAKLLQADTINFAFALDSLFYPIRIDINNDGEIQQRESLHLEYNSNVQNWKIRIFGSRFRACKI